MNRRLHRLALFCASFLAALAAVGLVFWRFGLRLALSDSAVPAGVYRFAPLNAAPSRGELVGACLPPAIARFALARGYLERSPITGCPDHTTPIGKLALGLPGDTVEIEPGFVVVNGHRFTKSATAMRDSRGRALSHVAFGAHQVGPGECWLFGFNNARSWDARYYGPVPFSSIKWRATPILTWGK